MSSLPGTASLQDTVLHATRQALLARINAGLLACVASGALTANAAFSEALTPARLTVVLVVLIMWHVLTCPRLLFCLEFGLYAAFIGYMALSILWTPDPQLAPNTLFPAVNFLLVLVLFGSLVAFHQSRAVLTGALAGVVLGVASYTYVERFPFVIPQDFSYNAIAAMYLFGLFLAFVYGGATGRRMLPLAFALVFLVLVTATTSIKTNLGIALGAFSAAFRYSTQTLRILRRNAIYLVLGVGVVAYVLLSNEVFVERLGSAFDRLGLGLEVLQARENIAGYSSFNERQYWLQEGLRAWAENPLFGHGVESFRARYGITSHSTPVDLLYNTGLVGATLFYSVFLALAVRVFGGRRSHDRNVNALTLAGIVCYVFMSLSGTLFYHAFLAAFIAICVALLRRQSTQLQYPELAQIPQ